MTLLEMLVVMGIIAALIAASVGSYSAMTRFADKARGRDLVQQVASALSTMYEKSGGEWPPAIARVGEKGGQLDERAAYAFVSNDEGTHYLTLQASGGKLIGYDRFGVLDPWGLAVMKKAGANVKREAVTKGAGSDFDHLLWFAVDEDGDGIISGVRVGGQAIDVRATAIVWGGGRDGKIERYSVGRRKDDLYSWSDGQTKNVK